MRCLFIIQGEGRGHMTQALALQALLRDAGHEVCAALVGRSARRSIPTFFLNKIGIPVETFESPNFVVDEHNRGVRIGPTVMQNLSRLPRFVEGFRKLRTQLRQHQPDVMVNFFEPLAGLFNLLFRPGVPLVCIGHQYMFHHPAYPFPPDTQLEQETARWFTRLTALGAARRLALSFYPEPDLPAQHLYVVPPLLRPELFAQPTDQQEPFLLIYLLNSGYAEAIIQWHGQHPDVPLHCFWDRQDAPETLAHDATLTFHQLSDTKFLSMMAACRGLVCTAGFESVCEAMYLGKPALMVPVEGHFEQYCNALDAAATGAGLYSKTFDLHRLLEYLPSYQSPAPRFRDWVAEAEPRFVAALEAVGSARR
jgi:uncharacterized protein (TIGR00661 family)